MNHHRWKMIMDIVRSIQGVKNEKHINWNCNRSSSNACYSLVEVMKHRLIIENYDADDPLDYDSKHKAYTDIIWISTEQYDRIIDIATEGIRKAGKSWRKTTARKH